MLPYNQCCLGRLRRSLRAGGDPARQLGGRGPPDWGTDDDHVSGSVLSRTLLEPARLTCTMQARWLGPRSRAQSLRTPGPSTRWAYMQVSHMWRPRRSAVHTRYPR